MGTQDVESDLLYIGHYKTDTEPDRVAWPQSITQDMTLYLLCTHIVSAARQKFFPYPARNLSH